MTHGAITGGAITHGAITHGAITHGAITHGTITRSRPARRPGHASRSRAAAAIWLAVAASGREAHAQTEPDPEQLDTDIEVPTLVLDTRPADSPGDSERELDLANIVEAAAKGRTTVQEAPAIITVLTEEDIASRHLTELEQVVDTVPGWMRMGGIHNQFPFAITRGTIQATMYMHDGMSLFDPVLNAPTMGRVMPMEIVKRVEMITGPGGVLWGANSYMGIVNVITKDADDIDGVEANVRLADGDGDRERVRGYVMAGIPRVGADGVSLMLHTSFESYLGPGFEMPGLLLASPLPQPNSQLWYGPLQRAEPQRSLVFNTSGKLSLGPVDVRFMAPVARIQKPLGFSGMIVQHELPEDAMCPFEPPFEAPGDDCLDKGRRARENRTDFFDRYVSADYKTRLADGRAGLSVKAYGIQFVRRFNLGVLPPVAQILEGGLGFDFDATSYRAGGSIDGDVELPRDVRLLYGVEAFHEWVGDNTRRSRQGAGIEAVFRGPNDVSRLPLPCPLDPSSQPGAPVFVDGCPLTFAFATNRTVMGAFVNPQWRPTQKLIVDGGARVQAAPGALGEQPYDTEYLFSGALVYRFLPGWYAKLNYAEGARPPVFSNTSGNAEATQIGGDRELDVETSQAMQAEVNARLFKGQRQIRELNFRADYSYTLLSNLIQVVSGEYQNTSNRGIHSAELLAKLYLQGGHRFELSYTWLRILMEDKGRHRSMPEHWFNLAGVFNLVDGVLAASTNLRVLGAMEDVNRLVEHRGLGLDDLGRPIDLATGAPSFVISQPHELVLDRLPPGAELTVGLTYTPTPRVRISGVAYNAFDARYYQPDAFFDYEPRVEFLPNPYEDFRFVLDATYTY